MLEPSGWRVPKGMRCQPEQGALARATKSFVPSICQYRLYLIPPHMVLWRVQKALYSLNAVELPAGAKILAYQSRESVQGTLIWLQTMCCKP